jgi:hypothetical protein
MKQQGRYVDNFDQDLWNTSCKDVVMRGNMAKVLLFYSFLKVLIHVQCMYMWWHHNFSFSVFLEKTNWNSTVYIQLYAIIFTENSAALSFYWKALFIIYCNQPRQKNKIERKSKLCKIKVIQIIVNLYDSNIIAYVLTHNL